MRHWGVKQESNRLQEGNEDTDGVSNNTITMKQYFAYLRVSSKKQTEGTSLDAQRACIEEYAAQHHISISSWYTETKTAASSDRTVFRTVLSRLQKKQADGLVIHTIDRSARNLKDWALLGELIDDGVDVIFTGEQLDLGARSSRLSADIQAVIAADYIRNLRIEAKKGIYHRLRQGLYPFQAPLGYLNQGGGKLKSVDPARAPFIKEAFERYATGSLSLAELSTTMHRAGLRDRRMRTTSPSMWSKILHNPFYMGTMEVKGARYPGLHEPLVSESLYEKAQSILANRSPKKTKKHTFRYSRLLQCATCGATLIGELQKGHRYYRCHTTGHTTSVREEAVTEQLRVLFKNKQFDPAWREKVDAAINEVIDRRPTEQYLKAQKLSLHALRARCDDIHRLSLDGLLSKKHTVLRQDVLQTEIDELERNLRTASKRARRMEHEREELRKVFLGDAMPGGSVDVYQTVHARLLIATELDNSVQFEGETLKLRLGGQI